MSESLGSNESREAILKNDLEKLFSAAYSDIHETSRRKFIAREVNRIYTPRHFPPEAHIAAGKDFDVNGYRYISFNRQQSLTEFGRRINIYSDLVFCSVVDYPGSDNRGSETIHYSFTADMLQPQIVYDERLAHIVQACLAYGQHLEE